ncbi:MARVEL domain-containing protein 3 [Suncus etruscus]|uniref:MARVEL domain-containing protein 3 n=1 Tax=Suncus etruscus TaxID=109475 RepID=UPI00210FB6AA|nr:MARVEL domain-containing protein 3 [Suncus etruscus]
MEGASGPRESRARPRERDPGRPPRADRERRPERPRDGTGQRREERSGAARRDPERERDRARGRDSRHDRAAIGEQRRPGGRSRPSRTRDAPPRPPWDAPPHPHAAPWGSPEPPPVWKEGLGRWGPESEFASDSYLPPYPGPRHEEVDYYQSEAQGLLDCHKCRYLCTGRGVVQIVEVILNGMVLMCIVASYFVLAGFSASFASGGGFGNNYYSPFEGTELEQVRQLDQQYTVLRAPLIYGGVAVALGLGVLTMGVLLKGARSLDRLPRRWLLLEAAFGVLAAVGYCVAIGFYLHGALQINSTDTCKARERLYARKGLTWMNCQLAGTDGAAATFACMLVVMYGASAVLALRSAREQKRLYKDSRSLHMSPRPAPEYMWSGTL